MVEIERCWCAKWPRRCTSSVTQEDMRCDLCRRGCCFVAAGDWSAHAEQVDVTFEVRLPAAFSR